MLDDQQPESLSAYSFFDIYLTTDPAGRPMARGLRALQADAHEGRIGVTEIPALLQRDTARLLELVEGHFRETSDHEFIVSHDEIIYRCSLIAAPGAVRRPAGMQYRDWCLRRVGAEAPILSDLGIPRSILAGLREAGKDRGLVIVSGSFGSGKSTTAAATLLDWVLQNRESAVTFEDPPEFPLAGRYPDGGIIHQVPVSQSTLSGAIISARRWAPRYVFLGEIRTPDAAAELLHMSISGPMTICTLHASDLVQALASLARFAGSSIGDQEARRMIAAAIRLIIHQDLSHGHMIMKQAVFHPLDAPSMRHKIEIGKFNALYEDFTRQATEAR